MPVRVTSSAGVPPWVEYRARNRRNWLDARIMASRSQTAMLAPVLLTAVAAGVALLALRRRRRIRRTDQLAARSRGCLLGAAVGDALGAGCEMMTRDGIAQVYGRVTAYIPEAEQKFGGGLKRIPGCYTDDTEMAIGLALSLVATRGGVDTIHIAEQHARLYSPWRGYGSGTTKVLEGLVSGTASPLTCGLELTRPSYEPKETWQGSKSNGYAAARPDALAPAITDCALWPAAAAQCASTRLASSPRQWAPRLSSCDARPPPRCCPRTRTRRSNPHPHLNPNP